MKLESMFESAKAVIQEVIRMFLRATRNKFTKEDTKQFSYVQTKKIYICLLGL